MGFNSVYQTLKEIFPQVDARLLKAVALEHAKDLDGAVEFILNEVRCSTNDEVDVAIPSVRNNGKMAERPSSSLVARSGKDDNNSRLLNDIHNDSDSLTSSFYDANDTEDLPNGNTRCEATVEVILAEKMNISSGSLISDCSKNDCIQLYGEQVGDACVHSRNYEDKSSDVHANITDDASLAMNSEHCEADVIVNQNCVEDAPIIGNQHDQQSLDDNLLGSAFSLDGVSITEVVTEMSNFVDPDFTQECPLIDGGTEGETALSTIGIHSGCRINLLEDMIQDAKNYKDVLFTTTESLMRLIEDVEHQEKETEQAKAAASSGGFDILEKVEEIKKLLKHAKEANEMHTGEVYGEKSILATEVRELQTRLLGLADEKDKSLAILDEMRKTLEVRLAVAEEERKEAEREMLVKQEFAKGALAEQELIMEKVVQESKLLQQEAEENAKLRDFLMEKGHVVDELQGEISVMCLDVKSLKEKMENLVGLKSLASSNCSVKSIASVIGSEHMELPEILSRMSSSPSVESQTETPKTTSQKELLDEGWELFDF